MKITVIGTDANDIADAVRVAHGIRKRIDREGYSLAVIEAISGEERPHVVLIRDTDLDTGLPYTAVSVTNPPKLFHLAGDALTDRQPDPDGEPVRCGVGCGLTDPDADPYLDRLAEADAVADAVADGGDCSGEVNCTYPEPHKHGFACDWTCGCKPARSHSTSNDPGSRLGGSRSASEPSSAPADHPGPSEAAEAAPTASKPKPPPGRRAPGRWW